MKNKKLIVKIIAIAVLSISVIAGKYVYFTATVNDGASDTVTVTSGSLSLTLNDREVTSLTTWTITPSDLSRTLYLRVTNNSPISVYAKLLFRELTNTYSEYLVYTLEQVNKNKTSLNPTNVLKSQVRVPESASASNQEMANGLSIPAGQTYYYKLTIQCLYSRTVNQSSYVGKKFYTGFGLEEGSEPPVRIISKAGSNLATGDKIAIGDQNFWVISNTDGTIRALAEYNLYVGQIYDDYEGTYTEISSSEAGYGLQSSDAKGRVSASSTWIGTVPFASTTQHGTNDSSYEGSILQSYINDYVALLNSTYGANVTGDAITEKELKRLCKPFRDFCTDPYPWEYTTSYWSRSADDFDAAWIVFSGGGIYFNGDFSNDNNFGVRPVIVISESSI